MTVIYSNMGDTDTAVLKLMWEGLDDVKVVSAAAPREELIAAIEAEEGTLLMCGHGSSRGLFSPNWGFAITDPLLRAHLKTRNVIGIWCYAAYFAAYNDYPGFYSSMFISNDGEAAMNDIYGYSNEQIWESERNFCKKVNELLKSETPLEDWQDILQASYDPENEIEAFNYEGLHYYN